MSSKSRIPTPHKNPQKSTEENASEVESSASKTYRTPQKNHQSMIPVKIHKSTTQAKCDKCENINREQNQEIEVKKQSTPRIKGAQLTPRKSAIQGKYSSGQTKKILSSTKKNTQIQKSITTPQKSPLKCASKEIFEITDSFSHDEKQDITNCTNLLDKILSENALFARNLSNLNIKPGILHNEINKLIGEEIYNKLIDLDPKSYRFCISGPHLSGKTSILFKLAELTFKRIEVVASDTNLFVIPLNFNRFNFKNPVTLYQNLITQIVNSAQHHCLEIIPYADLLRQWLINIIKGSVVDQPPACLSLIPKFNIKKIVAFGRKINSVFKYRDGLDEFVKLIFTFPNVFASAFGDRKPLYIIDNFDCARQSISKVSYFPDYFKNCQYYPHAMTMIENNAYIITACDFIEIQSETIFIELSNMCHLEGPQISCPLPVVTIYPSECFGCPGYLDYFLSIVAKIKDFQVTSKQLSAGLPLSICDKSRGQQIIKMIESLSNILAQNGSEKMKSILFNLPSLQIANIEISNND